MRSPSDRPWARRCCNLPTPNEKFYSSRLQVIVHRTIYRGGEARRGQFGGDVMSENKSMDVEVRRLWPSDMEAYRDHLLRLDARSRHERFGGGMSDDFLMHYAEHCFGGVTCSTAPSLTVICAVQQSCARARRSGASRRRLAGTSTPRRLSRSRTGTAGGASARSFVPPHPARRHQPWRRDDRDHLSAGQHRDADAGAEVQDAFHVRGKRADRAPRARRPTPFSIMREASADMLDFGAALFDAQWRAFHDVQASGA